MGELTNLLATARLALADMVRIANDFDFQPSVDIADAVLVRKTITANAVIATVEKKLWGGRRGFGTIVALCRTDEGAP